MEYNIAIESKFRRGNSDDQSENNFRVSSENSQTNTPLPASKRRVTEMDIIRCIIFIFCFVSMRLNY